MKKTAFIYNILEEEDLRYFVKDGEFTHLQGTYINEGKDTDAELQLAEILNDPPPSCSILELQLAVQAGASLIEVGFLD